MDLDSELLRIATAAEARAADGETLAGILAAEAAEGARAYLCAYDGPAGRTWLAFDGEARPLEDRAAVREVVSIAALCELAEESAGGGHLSDLRADLVALRITERPDGIDEAEEAALELERAIDTPPRLASPRYLDAVGSATRRLELALGDGGSSPFAEAMKHGMAAVDQLRAEVEAGYKATLS